MKMLLRYACLILAEECVGAILVIVFCPVQWAGLLALVILAIGVPALVVGCRQLADERFPPVIDGDRGQA